MKIDIMTLFPEMINAVMRESIIGRAQDKGLVEVKATNIRDYALDKHHKADDAPYGGGRGQVMLAEPLYLCHRGAERRRTCSHGVSLRTGRAVQSGKSA